jgi:hypothetical protein
MNKTKGEKMQKCLTCGRYIYNYFYFCFACGEKYGLLREDGKFKKPREWPDWARELYNDEVRERRREKRIREHEVSFEALEEEGYQFSVNDGIVVISRRQFNMNPYAELDEDNFQAFDDYRASPQVCIVYDEFLDADNDDFLS